MKESLNRGAFLKAFLIISALLAPPAFYQSWVQISDRGYNVWQSSRLILLIGYSINILAAFSLFIWTPERIFAFLDKKIKPNLFLRAFGIIALLFCSAILPYLTLFDINQFLPHGYPLLWTALWVSFVAAVSLKVGFRRALPKLFAISLLFLGAIARSASFAPTISSYPFSLGWSEVSRYYYASLFFSKSLYGEALPWTSLHPTRYLLQSIPFLFGNLTLSFHRLWQVFLWLGISSATSLVFACRLSKKINLFFLAMAGWYFLFIFQGAVYYHLQIPVLIILLGVDRKRPRLSLLAVVFASLWAGISRLNWYPVPAMLAIMIFLLEEPVSSFKNLWHYLSKPILWTITGTGAALASQSLYVFLSGNIDNIASFGSSFTSSLLWYRLFPNDTYSIGVLLPTILISLPLFGIIVVALKGKSQNWHWVRLLGLWSINIVLLIGGLVVSTKIGGGGDLHNLDAYIVTLGVWAGYMLTQRSASEIPGANPINSPHWQWVALAILIPVWMSLQAMRAMPTYDMENAEKSLNKLHSAVTQAAQQDEEVLFIEQRHLVTLGMIENIPLIPEYEVVDLMEMAMSENSVYLDAFHQDISEHRFGLIIVAPQFLVLKGADQPFFEESNTWIQNVSENILCYYEPQFRLQTERIYAYVPKEQVEPCVFSK